MALNAPREEPPLLINIGANKGYKLAEFVMQWTNRPVTLTKWLHEVMGYGKTINSGYLGLSGQTCGNCRECTKQRKDIPRFGPRAVAAHALELSPVNCQLLQAVVGKLRLDDIVHLHCPLGASNQSGLTWVPRVVAGYERVSLTAGIGRTRENMKGTAAERKGGEFVEVIRVDDFMERYGVSHASWVTVDAEGFDALIIEGMAKALQQKRIGVLEFEYSAVGAWAASQAGRKAALEPRTLKSTLEKLHRFGYLCYFQTRDSVFPASGQCWHDAFEFRGWSNLVCAHEPEALAILDRTAMDAWRQRKRDCTTSSSPYLPSELKGLRGDKAALISAFAAGNTSVVVRKTWQKHCPRTSDPQRPYDFTQLAGLYYS